MAENEIVVKDLGSEITNIATSADGFYSSLRLNNFEDKKKFTKLTSNSIPLVDNTNKELNLVDVVIQKVEVADENTGEFNEAPRVTLITDDGVAYHATSDGMLQAIRTIFRNLGEPAEWPEPLKVMAVERRGRRGFRYLTLDLV